MTTTKFKGTPVHIDGEFIRAGAQAPDFELVKGDLSPLKLSDLKGKRVVLNIFPSLDTGVCATSVRKFNKLASSLPDTVVVAVSKDLPFAQSRFCTTEGIANVVPASDFRAAGFAGAYGVLMADGRGGDRQGGEGGLHPARARNYRGTRLRCGRRGRESLLNLIK